MRIEQLQYIAAVTQHGSLRKASESLHISQPALSEAVSKLERELGVTLLDRRRSGARISREGLGLLENMSEVLEAVQRLRAAAGDQTLAGGTVRIGTVDAASSSVLAPAVREFRRTHDNTTIELVTARTDEIQRGLGEGALDLGLVNLLEGDDAPTELGSTALVSGRPVVVCPTNHPLAGQPVVHVDDLRKQDLVMMRPGYVMHRFVHRVLAGHRPTATLSADGAEMGKAMVVEGLGVTVLPDYSVVGDPRERAGLLTVRPIVGDHTEVSMVMLHRRGERANRASRELQAVLASHARLLRAS